jgi:hypothetical protein
MRGVGRLTVAFTAVMLLGACGGNRMAPVPRRDWITEGATR